MRSSVDDKLVVLYQSKEKCCGCGACLQKCPKSCISMQEDKEGFLYPIIDHNLCIRCGQCLSVCPFRGLFEESEPKTAFAAFSCDDAIRENSSSGGVFSLLARHFISIGGVVFGAIFDENWEVKHSCVTTEEELHKLRGSKYVQSSIGNSYVLAKEFLANGKPVLFSGTPCQIAGLNHYLGRNYNLLLTVDIICHGVPSPKVWKWYIDIIRSKNNASISGIDFRDKENGWRHFNLAFQFQQSGHVVKQSCYHREDPYMKAFLNNLSLRPSCSSCQTKAGKSHSDITLADFWSVEKVATITDNDKGISLVLVNSDKGTAVLSSLQNIFLQNVDFGNAIHYNKAWRESYPQNPDRNRFFSSYKRHKKDFDIFVEMRYDTKLSFVRKVKRFINKRLHRI